MDRASDLACLAQRETLLDLCNRAEALRNLAVAQTEGVDQMNQAPKVLVLLRVCAAQTLSQLLLHHSQLEKTRKEPKIKPAAPFLTFMLKLEQN